VAVEFPFGAWSFARRVRWALLASLIGVTMLPTTIDRLRPEPLQLHDFYQEWSSARNVLEGHPAYEPVPDSAHRYLGFPKNLEGWTGTVNVHPPSSLLLGLPLARLDYPNAFLVWNLISLILMVLSFWLIARGLELRATAWDWVPVVVLLLVGYPLQFQIVHGQLSLLLLFLITVAWYADRRGLAWIAGAALGAASAIKLFPAYLALYFLVRGRYAVLGYATGCFLLLAAATASFAGWDVFATYASEVVPHTSAWRAAAHNASLAGFWYRLFGASGHDVLAAPLAESPIGALLATAASDLAVTALSAVAVWRARGPGQETCAFALVVLAMLLVSPVTWEHSFLLLPLPLLTLWLGEPDAQRRLIWRGSALILAIAILSLPTLSIFDAALPGGLSSPSGTPLHSFTLFSLQLYTLLALWFAMWRRSTPGA
jgi:hypothetical protein